MKKRFLIMCLVSTFLLGGCGLRPNVNKDVLKGTAYEEYVDELGLKTLQKLNLRCYDDRDEDFAMLYMACDEEAGYQELSDKVKAHNEYVKANPDYFKGDESVSFVHDLGTKGLYQGDFFFYADLRDLYRYKDTLKSERRDLGEDLGRTNDDTFQYMYVSLYDCKYSHSFDHKVKYEVPVVILNSSYYSEFPGEEVRALFNSVEGVEQVVVTKYDKERTKEIYDELQKLVPDAEIYFEDYIDKKVYFIKAEF